jgi:hypothetical protein
VDISQTKYDLAKANQKLLDVRRANPYNVQKEIEITLEVQSLESGLEFATNVLKERF